MQNSPAPADILEPWGDDGPCVDRSSDPLHGPQANWNPTPVPTSPAGSIPGGLTS
jgi:hypothetical protein